MRVSTRILGATTAKHLKDSAAAALLTIGADVFHRSDLAGIDCFNFTAAATLSRILSDLNVRDTRDLYQNVPPSALIAPRIGSIAIAVLGAAFECKRIGGSDPLESWVARHRAKDAKRQWVTFTTMKHQEAKREIGEKRARRRRREQKHRRRNQAHSLRVQRFTERQEHATQ